MNTPIPFILLALDGKVDFIKKTSPFGDKSDKPKDYGDSLPDPDPNVASKVRGMLAGFGG